MYIVQVEHQIPDFATWKEAFDSDPIGRERSGVRRYRIMHPVDNPSYIVVDLEFDSLPAAEAMRDALRQLWGRVDVAGSSQQVRIVEEVETKEY
jgi:hypothetical protein